MAEDLISSSFLHRLERLVLRNRNLASGYEHGGKKSRHTGASLEFADYRNYTPGDDLRDVDWNVFARTDRIYVKLHEAEQNLHAALFLDCSASMAWSSYAHATADGPKFQLARQVIAAIAYIALSQQDAVWFHPANRAGTTSAPLRGKAAFHKLRKALNSLTIAEQADDLAGRLVRAAPRMPRRSLVFVISDFLDVNGYNEGLAALQAGDAEVQVIQVLHPQEKEPLLRGDHRLNEMESNRSIETAISTGTLQRYQAALAEHCQSLRYFCKRRQMGYLEVSATDSFESVVLRQMLQRRMLA